jgi:hypothetical protein
MTVAPLLKAACPQDATGRKEQETTRLVEISPVHSNRVATRAVT